MGIEYKIKFVMPMDFDPSALLRKLPSPIERSAMAEIYNYAEIQARDAIENQRTNH